LPDTLDGKRQEIETRLDALQKRKQRISKDISQAQNIFQFNEWKLDGLDSELLGDLTGGDGSGTSTSLTDEFVEGSEQIPCWTCGSTVERKRISSILDQLRELRQSKLQDRSEIEREIQDPQSEKQELAQQQ
jgi:hypothetical protein